MVSYDQAKQAIKIELSNGMVENISDDAVQLEELKMIAEQTGKPFDVLLNDRYGKYLPVAQFQPLPPRSDSVDFRTLFKSETEALTETDYWTQIGSIQFVAKYAGREYRKKFSREEIMIEIDRVKPKPDLPYPAIKAGR